MSLAQTLLDMAEQGGKKIAFIVTSDDWGRSAVAAYGEAFQETGRRPSWQPNISTATTPISPST